MKNFDLERFKKGDIIVSFNTIEKLINFYNYIRSGSGVVNEVQYMTIIWMRHKEETYCLWKKNNCLLEYTKYPVEYFDEHHYEIIEWSIDYINKYEINITSNGAETNCIYKENGDIMNKSSLEQISNNNFNFERDANLCLEKIFKEKNIKKGTKFKVLNVDSHKFGYENFVCLNAYIGQIGVFNESFNSNNLNWSSGTFEKEYINAIDKENGKLIWHKSEIEILEG